MMIRPRALPWLVILSLLVTACPAFAGNWPQWRGPLHNGSATETGLPEKWSMTENMLWTAEMPGMSGSTPIVWGNRVFISSIDEKTDGLLAMCFDAGTGKLLWRKEIGKNIDVPRNNSSTPSPVTDGKTVWFYYGTGALIAFDFDGKELWSRDLLKTEGVFALMFGYSSTPLLYKGKLYIVVLQNKRAGRYGHCRRNGDRAADSFLMAIDPQTGKTLWRHVRLTDARDEAQEAYVSAIPFEWNGRSEVLVYGADYLTGHDPETGKELWRWGGYNPGHIHHWRIVTSPLPGDGLIYVVAPKHAPVYAIKAGGNGRVGGDYVAWKLDSPSPDAAMPLLYQGRLYLLQDDRKVIACVNPKTGEKIWEGPLGGRTVYRASITGADGKLYCMDEAANVVVLRAGDKFEVLHRMAMGRRLSRSSIVAANGKLFIRTVEKLYCIGEKTR